VQFSPFRIFQFIKNQLTNEINAEDSLYVENREFFYSGIEGDIKNRETSVDCFTMFADHIN